VSEEPNKGGRPTEYRPEYAKEARKLCMLGATDKDLADFFEVSESTINLWKLTHPKFSESIKAGKAKADALVATRLFCRAIGYQHDAVKILTVSDGNNSGSHVEEVPYIERYPPDTAAAIFWLKNRRPELWRDKQDVEHAGKGGGPIAVEVTHRIIDPAKS
jgi:hypothetical protein